MSNNYGYPPPPSQNPSLPSGTHPTNWRGNSGIQSNNYNHRPYTSSRGGGRGGGGGGNSRGGGGGRGYYNNNGYGRGRGNYHGNTGRSSTDTTMDNLLPQPFQQTHAVNANHLVMVPPPRHSPSAQYNNYQPLPPPPPYDIPSDTTPHYDDYAATVLPTGILDEETARDAAVADTARPLERYGGINPDDSRLQTMFSMDIYRQQIMNILRSTEPKGQYGIQIKWMDLIDSVPELISQLEMNPRYVLGILSSACREAMALIMNAPEKIHIPDHHQLHIKPNVNARVYEIGYIPPIVANMVPVEISALSANSSSSSSSNPKILHPPPNIENIVRNNVSSIRANDKGRYISVHGTIIRTGQPKLVQRYRWFECAEAKCAYRFLLRVEIEHDNTVLMPSKCPNRHPIDKKGKKFCTSRVFKPCEEEENVMTDYQEVKLQEPVSSLSVGSIPRSMVVVLEHDLVDTVRAGDDVVICGIVVHRWLRMSKGQRAELEVILQAVHVRVASRTGSHVEIKDSLVHDFHDFWTYFVTQQRPLRARDILARSVCPQLHGMALLKLVLLMILIGANEVQHGDQNATIKTRGDCHLLLIGDPGTGKSQLMRYAAHLVPRSVHTTGVGTTSAGLVATATQDGGDWVLEAGALVLADRGLCCIDEFASMRSEDRTAIHEAMEQQTVSIAKAGLRTTLNTRCTIIAASNPRGKGIGEGIDLSAATGIDPPLLSRFDLIMVIEDRKDSGWDDRITSFILAQACSGGMINLASQVVYAEQQQLIHDQHHQQSSHQHHHPQAPKHPHLGSSQPSEQSNAAESLRKLYEHEKRAFVRLHASLVDPQHVEVSVNNGGRLADGRRIEDQLTVTRDDSIPPPPAPGNTGFRATSNNINYPNNTLQPKKSQYWTSGIEVRWSLGRLQAYIAYVKNNIFPSLTRPAEQIIKLYFLMQRSQGPNRDASRTTARFLESAVRLTRAHARLMFRTRCIIQDAVYAIALLESSAATVSSGMVPNVPVAQTEFVPVPDEDYLTLEEGILRRLVQFVHTSRNLLHDTNGSSTIIDPDIPTTLNEWQNLSRVQMYQETENPSLPIRNTEGYNLQPAAVSIQPGMNPMNHDSRMQHQEHQRNNMGTGLPQRDPPLPPSSSRNKPTTVIDIPDDDEEYPSAIFDIPATNNTQESVVYPPFSQRMNKSSVVVGSKRTFPPTEEFHTSSNFPPDVSEQHTKRGSFHPSTEASIVPQRYSNNTDREISSSYGPADTINSYSSVQAVRLSTKVESPVSVNTNHHNYHSQVPVLDTQSNGFGNNKPISSIASLSSSVPSSFNRSGGTTMTTNVVGPAMTMTSSSTTLSSYPAEEEEEEGIPELDA